MYPLKLVTVGLDALAVSAVLVGALAHPAAAAGRTPPEATQHALDELANWTC